MNKLTATLLSAICLSACGPINVKNEYMAFEDVRTVSDIPVKQKLTREGMTAILPEDMYIEDFVIHDSLLIIDTNSEHGILDILSFNTMESLGRLFDRGNADGEFPWGLDLTLQSTVYAGPDSLYIDSFDFIKGKFYRANISKAIAGATAEVYPLSQDYEYPRPVFWAKHMGDSLLYFRSGGDTQTRQERVILSGSEKVPNEHIDRLNDFEVPLGEDFNIMSTLMAVSPDGRMIVEAPLGLNYIDVYSLFDDTAFTICVGDEMLALSDILGRSRIDRPYMFGMVRAYDFGFGVLKLDTTDFKLQTGMSSPPELLFFDWTGRPLALIESDFNYLFFDYDVNNKELYVVDSDGRMRKTTLSI